MHDPKPFRNLSGEEVNVVHFPGKSRILQKDILEDLADTRVKIDTDYITIVSAITPDHLELSPLHRQLKANDISYINPAEKFEGTWHRNIKPALILEGLKKVKTKYCLVLDGDDLAIAKDITFKDVRSLIAAYGQAVIFNATGNRFPNLHVDTVENREELGQFRYLNAGAAVGETDELINLYKSVTDEIQSESSNIDSEQYYVRRYFDTHKDTVWFDHKNIFFQAINIGIGIEKD